MLLMLHLAARCYGIDRSSRTRDLSKAHIGQNIADIGDENGSVSMCSLGDLLLWATYADILKRSRNQLQSELSVRHVRWERNATLGENLDLDGERLHVLDGLFDTVVDLVRSGTAAN